MESRQHALRDSSGKVNIIADGIGWEETIDRPRRKQPLRNDLTEQCCASSKSFLASEFPGWRVAPAQFPGMEEWRPSMKGTQIGQRDARCLMRDLRIGSDARIRKPVNSGVAMSLVFHSIGVRRRRACSIVSSGLAFCSPCWERSLGVIGSDLLHKGGLQFRLIRLPTTPTAREASRT